MPEYDRSVAYAVVTTRRDMPFSGLVPMFWTKDPEERERVAMNICRIANVAVHDLQNGTYILIKADQQG